MKVVCVCVCACQVFSLSFVLLILLTVSPTKDFNELRSESQEESVKETEILLLTSRTLGSPASAPYRLRCVSQPQYESVGQNKQHTVCLLYASESYL